MILVGVNKDFYTGSLLNLISSHNYVEVNNSNIYILSFCVAGVQPNALG